MNERASFFATFWRMLSARQRRRYVALQVLFFLSGILQVAGAGSIAPFVALMSNPSIVQKYPMLGWAVEALGLSSEREILVAFALGTIAIISCANMVAALATWAIFRFTFWLGGELQRDLLAAYLHRPFAKLSRDNSTTLISTLAQGAPRFTYNVAQPLLMLCSQIMVVVAVFALLAWYSPRALVAFIALAGGGYGIMFYLVRKRLVFHGEFAYAVHQSKLRILTESLGGLKEIRLAGIERDYLARFAELTDRGQRSEAMVGLLGDLPRFLIETIAFTLLLGFAILQITSGAPSAEVVGMLSVFAMAGYRLLPAGQTIFKSVSQVRANAPVMDELLPDLQAGRTLFSSTEVPEVVGSMPSGDIVLDDVWFSYEGSSEPVLRGISATIRQHQITVVVGRSGSGKSTLVDLAMGFLEPQRGRISVGGVEVGANRRAWQKQIGYVPQSIFLLDDTIAANVAFGSPKGVSDERLARALRLAHLDDLIASLPSGWSYRVGERGALLSGGQRQRVGLARALYNEPAVLVLDEATSALDGSTEQSLIGVLRELRRATTIIMIAHRVATIRAADNVVMVREGKVEAQGSYDELLRSSAAFRALIAATELEESQESSEYPGQI